MRALVTVFCLVAFFNFHLIGQAKPRPALDERLQTIIAAHHGDVAIYAEDLQTHQTVQISADTPVQTASVIKLSILYEALEQVRAGKVHFEDRIMLTKPDQVQGSGVLLFFDAPLAASSLPFRIHAVNIECNTLLVTATTHKMNEFDLV